MLNTGKYINVFSSGFSYIIGRILKKPFVSGMPVALGIELTNSCNLNCPECASGSGLMKRKHGFMSESLFYKIISETGRYLYNINLYFQGEPMMHPEFFRLVEQARGTSITVSTNGHFLTDNNNSELAKSGIKKLIVSLDGMDSKTYSRYRVGGDFNKVISGLRGLSAEIERTKSSLKPEIQFLVNSYNEKQIEVARKFAREVNYAIKFKSMQVINPGDISQWMPKDERFRRYYKNHSGQYLIKKTHASSCFRLWTNPVITWDGKVLPCCFDKDADHIMGDLNESSFREIWQGERFRNFRQRVLSERDKIEICGNCTTGLRGVEF
jgi:radical SAM protein with 4Fe4S-binding SPASM domain